MPLLQQTLPTVVQATYNTLTMEEQTTRSTGTRIARAMMVVLFFHLFWKLGGFILGNVLSGLYGLKDVTDAYTIGLNGIVFALFLIVEESMGPAFLPVFIYRLKDDGEAKAWDFGNTIFTLLFAVLCVTIMVGVLFTPQIVDFAAPGFISEGRMGARACAITLVGIGFPGLLGLALGSLTYVILNAYKVFGYPAAGDAVQKFLWVAVLWVLSSVLGANPVYIAIGFIAGAAAKIGVHLVRLRDKLHLLRFRLNLRSPDMRRFLILLTPLLIGIVGAKARDFITRMIGSYLPEGQLSAVAWGKKVGDFPVLILPYALSIAMFPYLCDMAKDKDYKQFGSVVSNALKLLAMFFIPLTIGAIIMRYSVVQFLYDWGKWTDTSTGLTSLAFGCYVIAIVFYASEAILMQSFFSMQNTWIPVSVGLAASFLQIAGLYAAVNFLDLNRFYCVALAFPLSRIIKNLVLIGLMKKKIPILPWQDTLRFLTKMAVICVGVGGAMYVTDLFAGSLLGLPTGSRGFLNPLVGARLALASLAGTAAFVVLCFVLRLKEARLVVDWVRAEGWERIRTRLGR